MNKLLLIALVIIGFTTVDCTRVRLSNYFDEKTLDKIEKLKSTHWGQLVFNLAELHALTQGPLEDLLSALEKLISQSKRDKAAEQADFDREELLHNRQIDYLDNQIRSAQDDISSTYNRLQNVLLPTKKQLAESIADLQSNIAVNLAQTRKEVAGRKAEHAVFQAIADEHNEAIRDLDQAITVVTALQQKSSVLVEVVIYQHSISKLAAALRRHDKYTPWVQSLISITEKLKSKDPESIRGCIKLLNEIRDSIVQALQEYTAIEEQHVKAFNERMASLKEDLEGLQTRLTSEIQNEIDNNKAIQAAKDFSVQRTQDLKLRKQQKVDENARWQETSALHDQFVKDITQEISTSTEALNYLKDANFGAYLRRRIQEAGVKDSISKTTA